MESHMSSHDVLQMIHKRYQNDTVLLVVTASNNIPSVRSVDSFYHEGSFWIVTDLQCRYVQEIQSNPNVMISDGGHNRFWCKATVTGHPLEPANQAIRPVFLSVFKPWYEAVNNESMSTVCYIKVTPYKGYIHDNKIGYSFDFMKNSVQVNPITHHIDVKLEPFWP